MLIINTNKRTDKKNTQPTHKVICRKPHPSNQTTRRSKKCIYNGAWLVVGISGSSRLSGKKSTSQAPAPPPRQPPPHPPSYTNHPTVLIPHYTPTHPTAPLITRLPPDPRPGTLLSTRPPPTALTRPTSPNRHLASSFSRPPQPPHRNRQSSTTLPCPSTTTSHPDTPHYTQQTPPHRRPTPTESPDFHTLTWIAEMKIVFGRPR